ncbi:MAG: hypothetical protein C5B55_04050 [Blastocatellia bacterium]|nr:MAG: hypothetical protein C5B55_04050 [Blastocatellia bacterium]
MQVAFGFKAHSGWAALVVLGKDASSNRQPDYVVRARRRVELVEEAWAKQPYHAAEEVEPNEARRVVEDGIQSAQRIATREVREAVNREKKLGNEVVACAVLTGNPMPAWSVAEILAVHFRMHKAEGVLFREALVRAAEKCSLPVSAINEKLLMKEAARALKVSTDQVTKKLAVLGKVAGAPWGKDQKEAALAAMLALSQY